MAELEVDWGSPGGRLPLYVRLGVWVSGVAVQMLVGVLCEVVAVSFCMRGVLVYV